jgi:hypothetical protein
MLQQAFSEATVDFWRLPKRHQTFRLFAPRSPYPFVPFSHYGLFRINEALAGAATLNGWRQQLLQFRDGTFRLNFPSFPYFAKIASRISVDNHDLAVQIERSRTLPTHLHSSRLLPFRFLQKWQSRSGGL